MAALSCLPVMSLTRPHEIIAFTMMTCWRGHLYVGDVCSTCQQLDAVERNTQAVKDLQRQQLELHEAERRRAEKKERDDGLWRRLGEVEQQYERENARAPRHTPTDSTPELHDPMASGQPVKRHANPRVLYPSGLGGSWTYLLDRLRGIPLVLDLDGARVLAQRMGPHVQHPEVHSAIEWLYAGLKERAAADHRDAFSEDMLFERIRRQDAFRRLLRAVMIAERDYRTRTGAKLWRV